MMVMNDAAKTVRARQRSDWPWKISLRDLAKPVTSSGASSKVKASLNEKADDMRTDVKAAETIMGRPPRSGRIWSHTRT